MKSKCFLFLTLLSFLVACVKDEHPHQRAQGRVVKFKGDPSSFLHGTTLNKKQGIPLDLFSDDQQKWSLFVTGFSQGEQVDYKEKVKSQQPKSIEEIESNKVRIIKYTLEKKSAQDYQLTPDTEEALTFHFFQEEDYLAFKDISFKGQSFSKRGNKTELQHYSTRKDQNVFNFLLLIYERSTNKKHLLSYNFVKHEDRSLLEQTLNKGYEYLFGPGIKTAWNQKEILQVNVCKTHMPTLNSWAKLSISLWGNHLKDRLNLQVEESSNCPPFSDLNSVNVYHIDGWIEVLGKPLTAALVLPVPNWYKDQIVDADMFVLKSEIDESMRLSGNSTFSWSEDYMKGNLRFMNWYSPVITHETGHILGLGHKMNGEKSIMSYDEDVNSIQDYDIKAVQELYPVLEEPWWSSFL